MCHSVWKKSGWLVSVWRQILFKSGRKREKSKCLKIYLGDMRYHFPPVSGSSQLHNCCIPIIIDSLEKRDIQYCFIFRYFWGSLHFVQIVTESAFNFLWETKQTCFCRFINRACVAHVCIAFKVWISTIGCVNS